MAMSHEHAETSQEEHTGAQRSRHQSISSSNVEESGKRPSFNMAGVATTAVAPTPHAASRRKSLFPKVALPAAFLSQFMHKRMTIRPDKIPIRYENTYRMCPKEDERFNANESKDIIEHSLLHFLDGWDYDAKEAKEKCETIADSIRRRIKQELIVPRYKIIVNVFIVQTNQQDIRVSSRCLWDADTDDCATGWYKGKDSAACAIVHGIYAE